ncbi:DNA damage-inducible protein 1 [Coemansia sp. RSA 2704]|nr:DNA damage-inducible protein 1 [Coemansia sp. RSA 2704]
MRLHIIHGDDAFSVEVDESMQLDDLHAVLEMDCNVSKDRLVLLHNGKPVTENKQLGELGFKADDTLHVFDKAQQQPARVAGGNSNSSNAGGNGSGSGLSPQLEAHRQQVLGNPQLMRQLEQTHPDIAEAARSNPAEFGRLLMQLREQQEQAAQQQQQEMERLNADPFDVEAQQRIEEMIRQENIMRNMEVALEHNPESFASVTMLYIDVVVNGTPIKALVDSGAQATVMSRTCAEQCGIMRLVDKRFAGEARGVGRAKIHGRVHNAQMKLGDQLLMCSFTVMEGAHINLLFGLDMLKRHQMCIDLKQNALVIGEASIKFLPEHLIPKSDLEGPVPPMAAAPSDSARADSAASQPPQQAPQQPPLSTSYPEETIKFVMDLGVSREQAIYYLDAADGDANAAASMIFS